MSKALPPDLLAVVERLERAESFDGLAADYEAAERESRRWVWRATFEWCADVLPWMAVFVLTAILLGSAVQYLLGPMFPHVAIVFGVIGLVFSMWEASKRKRQIEPLVLVSSTPATRLIGVVDRWRIQAGVAAVKANR